MAVGRIETALVSIPVLAVVGFVGYTIYSTVAANATREEAARGAGFASFAEQSQAAERGAKTPAEWRAKLAEDATREKAAQEERARAEADRKRQWEADAPKRAAAEAELLKRARAEIENSQAPTVRMSLTGQSWSTGGFDTIGMMSFTVKNENPYEIKDFVISCTFHGNSGTMLGERLHTVYETVKAKTSRPFSRVNIGFIPSQSARGGCSLISAVRI